MSTHLGAALACIPLLLLAGCSLHAARPPEQQNAVRGSNSARADDTLANSSGKTFTSNRYGVRIDYPGDWILRRTFKRNYLANGDWKTYTGPDSPPGQPLVALVLPGSNRVTAAELRLGVSRQPNALRTCTDLPAAARPGTQKKTIISDVPFTTFEAGDAAMSHYLTTRSYRAVHHSVCYAMDVLVFGANPRVYDPPATPPFTKAQAFARLIPVAQKLQFIAGSSPATAATLLTPPSTYKGLLPCADCPGIVYQLNLLPDHRYLMRLNYQDRAARFDESGRWHLADETKKLLLQSGDAHTSMQQWAVLDDGHRLRLLDSTGQPIRSGLNYDLTRRAQFEPLAAEPAD